MLYKKGKHNAYKDMLMNKLSIMKVNFAIRSVCMKNNVTKMSIGMSSVKNFQFFIHKQHVPATCAKAYRQKEFWVQSHPNPSNC